MAEPYRSQADLEQRLDFTICHWDGEPYYVRVSGARDTRYPLVDLYRISGEQWTAKVFKTVDHTNIRFNDRSPSLGYMNYNGQAYYISRVPTRTNNQGIRESSISSSCGTLPRQSGWFHDKPMYNCIKGIYPTVDQAMRTLGAHEAFGVAVSRDTALKYIDRRTLGMYFKDRLAAIWNEKEKTWDYRDSADSTIVRKIIKKTGLF